MSDTEKEFVELFVAKMREVAAEIHKEEENSVLYGDGNWPAITGEISFYVGERPSVILEPK